MAGTECEGESRSGGQKVRQGQMLLGLVGQVKMLGFYSHYNKKSWKNFKQRVTW